MGPKPGPRGTAGDPEALSLLKPMSIAENVARVEEEIAAACRRAGRPRAEVRLMAVSKTNPAGAIGEAVAAGLRLFGENRVQEFQSKTAELAQMGLAVGLDGGLASVAPGSTLQTTATPGPDATCLEVHLIGHLQSNKAAKAVEIFTAVDTLDSLRLAERLNDAARKLERVLPVLLEVKLSPEEAKTGLEQNETEFADLLERLPDLEWLRVRGLMTVPPWSEDAETARPYFAELRALRDRVAQAHPRLDFSELSMGMSGDFAVAIEEGSTSVRIGTAIFGKRLKPA